MYSRKTRINANKVTPGVLSVGDVVTQNISSAGVKVGAGRICRITVSATTYIAFGSASIGSVSSTTSPGLRLDSGVHLVVADDDYIRASATVDRLELL